MSIKLDLKDVTFLTPVQIESIDRLENVLLVVDFLNNHFATNLMILEAGSHFNGILSRCLPRNVKYIFEKSHDPIFHRTHYINDMVKLATTPIISVWDSDVLVDITQVIRSVSLIRENKAEFVIPYNGKFLDTSHIIRELYLEKKDLKVLKRNKNKMKELYSDAVGGAFFAQKKAYTKAGMENENFYGWGHEDGERINRWRNLDYSFERVEGHMYHLTHSRSINSYFHSKSQSNIKSAELERLALMSKEEMLREIENW